MVTGETDVPNAGSLSSKNTGTKKTGPQFEYWETGLETNDK
jgi:hypothetical protein